MSPRVTGAAAAPPCAGRSSSRSAARTANTKAAGGDVILVVDQDVTTLLDYHHHPHRKATSGKPGEGGNRSGKDGTDLVLPVPDGTVVQDKHGNVLADLVGQGHHLRGRAGRGAGRSGQRGAGLGPPRGAQGFALLGEPGQDPGHRA